MRPSVSRIDAPKPPRDRCFPGEQHSARRRACSEAETRTHRFRHHDKRQSSRSSVALSQWNESSAPPAPTVAAVSFDRVSAVSTTLLLVSRTRHAAAARARCRSVIRNQQRAPRGWREESGSSCWRLRWGLRAVRSRLPSRLAWWRCGGSRLRGSPPTHVRGHINRHCRGRPSGNGSGDAHAPTDDRAAAGSTATSWIRPKRSSFCCAISGAGARG